MFTIEVQGLAATRARLASLPRQFRFAGALALNDTAFAVRSALVAEIGRAFDRPTPYIQRSPWYGKATPERLEATVGIGFTGSSAYRPETLSSGIIRGGKGIDPANVLRAEVHGGERKLKAAERALQRIGVLPQGLFMVPGAGAPRDAYGNVPGAFIQQLLSYFSAFGEQGFKANMTAKRRASLKRGSKRMGGVEYFVSRGRGEFTGAGSWKNGHAQHLPRGIWARGSAGGSFAGPVRPVRPIFLFVKPPAYRQRLRMGEVVAATAQRELPRAFDTRLKRALATAH